jgi:hypothetical protein
MGSIVFFFDKLLRRIFGKKSAIYPRRPFAIAWPALLFCVICLGYPRGLPCILRRPSPWFGKGEILSLFILACFDFGQPFFVLSHAIYHIGHFHLYAFLLSVALGIMIDDPNPTPTPSASKLPWARHFFLIYRSRNIFRPSRRSTLTTYKVQLAE